MPPITTPMTRRIPTTAATGWGLRSRVLPGVPTIPAEGVEVCDKEEFVEEGVIPRVTGFGLPQLWQ